MQYRFFILSFLLIVSCTSPDRKDILFEDFEKGEFANWKSQGNSFNSPVHIDSVPINFKNANGKFVAFSNFEGEGESKSQGKLISKPFIIQRNFINFLIAGGNHDVRECVNLIVKNKIVKVATGKNDSILRKVTWDVSAFEGENAVLEIVDAMATSFEKKALGFVVVDQIVFSDNLHQKNLVFEDFESGTYNDWIVEGNAFEIPRNRTNVYYPISVNGFSGQYFAFSFGSNHDIKQGKLTSKPFIINYDYIKLLVGGGNHLKLTCVNLVVNNTVVKTATGQNDGELRNHKWQVKDLKGKVAHIEVVDHFSDGWGHIMVDDIVFVNDNPWYLKLFVWFGILILGIIFFFVFNHKRKLKQVSKNETVIKIENEKLKDLKALIKSSKLYLNSDFSIKDIIATSSLSENDIKELLENNNSFSLSDYINYLRVEEFKTRINDPENEIYTMISVAKQCGFKSKTSFYRVFKQVTNQTPTAYKKES